MNGNVVSAGMIVLHPRKPEWGPGKVVHVDSKHVYVFWRDSSEHEVKKLNQSVVQLDVAPEQSDPILDNLPPLVNKDGTFVKLPDRLTVAQAMDRFLTRFRGGFYDQDYIGTKSDGERQYKWNAHIACVEALGNGRYRSLLETDRRELVAKIQRCYRSVNLLSPYEKSALTDAFRDETKVDGFLRTLADVLEADSVTQSVMAPYFDAVSNLPADRGRVATWPVATIVPFLMKPQIHLFLKPEVTQNAATALGFHLNYKAEPNWPTYERLLTMGRLYMEQLASLKPRDMIDVQSFFYVVCGGYRQLGVEK